MFSLIDFKRLDFAFASFAFWILGVQTSPFMFSVQISGIQTSPLPAYCKLGVQTSPSYGSNVQISSASHLLASEFGRSDFIFYISDVQTSPSYGSDVQISSTSLLLASQLRRSDFTFIWIKCSDFISITCIC